MKEFNQEESEELQRMMSAQASLTENPFSLGKKQRKCNNAKRPKPRKKKR